MGHNVLSCLDHLFDTSTFVLWSKGKELMGAGETFQSGPILLWFGCIETSDGQSVQKAWLRYSPYTTLTFCWWGSTKRYSTAELDRSNTHRYLTDRHCTIHIKHSRNNRERAIRVTETLHQPPQLRHTRLLAGAMGQLFG